MKSEGLLKICRMNEQMKGILLTWRFKVIGHGSEDIFLLRAIIKYGDIWGCLGKYNSVSFFDCDLNFCKIYWD